MLKHDELCTIIAHFTDLHTILNCTFEKKIVFRIVFYERVSLLEIHISGLSVLESLAVSLRIV